MFDFPTNPASGTVVMVPDGSYRVWDSTKWRASPSSSTITTGPFLPIAGGVMSGALSLFGNATLPLHAVPLQQLTAATAGGPFLPLSGSTPMAGPLIYTATGGTVARSAQDRAADVANVLDYGADPSGATDSTAALQAAISHAGSFGAVSFPTGTYVFNAPLIRPGGQRWNGESQSGTVLKWIGANNASLIQTPTDNSSLYGGINDLTIDTGTATGCTALVLTNANYGSYARLHIKGNDGLNNRGIAFIALASPIGNCGENSFYHCTIDGITRGIYMTGTTGGGVATLQSFQHLTINLTGTAIGTGIEFDQWADSHYFHYARVTLAHINSIALKFHTTPPAGSPTVYSVHFYGLAIDGVGSWGGSTGFWINYGYGITAKGVFNTLNYPDLLVTDVNPAAGAVYLIECVVGAIHGGGTTKIYSRGVTGDDLSCPMYGLRAGNFYRTPSSGPCVGATWPASVLLAVPFSIGNTSVVRTLSINVTAANAGAATHYRLGIYSDRGDFVPYNLLAAAPEMTVAAGATGVQTSAVLNAGAGVLLARGIYWLMFLGDVGGSSVSSIGGAGGTVTFAPMTTGAGTLADAFTGNLGCGWYQSQAYGALPDPAPAMIATFTTPMPAIVVGA